MGANVAVSPGAVIGRTAVSLATWGNVSASSLGFFSSRSASNTQEGNLELSEQ
jgi:hypothetical protein